MTGALILLALVVVTGVVLYLLHRRNPGADEPVEESAAAPPDDEECCGRHAVCEKTSLLTGVDNEIIYYDDEELDRYRGRKADSYTPEEEEEFREVLMTLLPEDVAGWARSIAMRGLELPVAVRDELLMIVGDLR